MNSTPVDGRSGAILKEICTIMDLSSRDWAPDKELWAIYQLAHGDKADPVESGAFIGRKNNGWVKDDKRRKR